MRLERIASVNLVGAAGIVNVFRLPGIPPVNGSPATPPISETGGRNIAPIDRPGGHRQSFLPVLRRFPPVLKLRKETLKPNGTGKATGTESGRSAGAGARKCFRAFLDLLRWIRERRHVHRSGGAGIVRRPVTASIGPAADSSKDRAIRSGHWNCPLPGVRRE